MNLCGRLTPVSTRNRRTALATTGEFVRPQHEGRWTVHDGERYSTHPVGYVVYLAAIYLSYPAIGELSAECIIDTGCRAGRPVRDRMHFAGSAMRGIAAAAVVLVTALFSANVLVALAAGVVCMVLMLTQWDTPAVVAGVLLLAHAALAAKAWQRPSIRVGVLSGLALGALVLVRSIYLYSLVIVPLVWLAGVWLIPSQRRRTAPAFVALTLSACVVVAPWMTRNWVQGGAFAVSAGGGRVLAIRAEYGLMTWPEVGSAFAYFLSNRVPFRAAAMRRLTAGPNGYVRFDRGDERSYYHRAISRTGRVASLADAADPGWRTASITRQDAALSAAAMAVYREHWLKQIALTVVFLHRGTAGGGWLLAAPLCLFLVCRRRDYRLAFLLAPMLWTAAMLSIGTHYIVRYSFPFIPVGTVLLALALQDLWALICKVIGCQHLSGKTAP